MVAYTGGYPNPSPSPSPPNPRLSLKPTLATLSTATDALEAKQRKELGLTCLPPKPTTRKYMRKMLPPVPVKAVAEGAAAAPSRAPLAPIPHNIVSRQDRAPASTPAATAVPPPFRPAPAHSSHEEDHSTSRQPSGPLVGRHTTGSTEARSWRSDTPHPSKNRQRQSAAEYLTEKRMKRTMRDRTEQMDLVDLAIAVSATQKW